MKDFDRQEMDMKNYYGNGRNMLDYLGHIQKLFRMTPVYFLREVGALNDLPLGAGQKELGPK